MITSIDSNRAPGTISSAIAVGNFDGFHLGHKKIIDTLRAISNEKKLAPFIVTFKPNPKVYFNPGFQLIHTDTQKKKILENQNVDNVFVIDFPSIEKMSDNAFLKKFLVDRYHMKHIIIGENFRFGKGREGDTRSLKEASQTFGFEYTVVAPVTIDGIRISSTYIRQQLANGQIETTNRMLGRNYSIEGIVIEGDKIGRQMGFPTINIQTENSLLPEGVFKTTVEIEDHPKSYRSITYIGYRPTFMGEKKKVESHIFNFDGKVYGKQVNLSFEKKLRDEIKFDSEISLVKQIRADIENLMVDKEHVF